MNLEAWMPEQCVFHCHVQLLIRDKPEIDNPFIWLLWVPERVIRGYVKPPGLNLFAFSGYFIKI